MRTNTFRRGAGRVAAFGLSAALVMGFAPVTPVTVQEMLTGGGR